MKQPYDVAAESELNLTGVWTLSSPQLPGKIFQAELPGDNYSALLAAGEIADPYWGENEKLVQRYADYTWEFSREFSVEEAFLQHRELLLELTMADTFGSVFVNGTRVLSVCNMFRQYRVNVKPYLRCGRNKIKIIFLPVLPEAEKINRKQPYEMLMSGCCSAPHMNLIRKVQCHGGWDWGIKLRGCGVYGSCRIIAADGFVLESVHTKQRFLRDGSVLVKAVAVLQVGNPGRYSVRFGFAGTEQQKLQRCTRGRNEVCAEFLLKEPKLWWPNGYGAQPLYSLEIHAGGFCKEVRIGIRWIEVVNRHDRFGTSMFFRVNGVDIFARGANWIPCDALPSRQSRERYENLLESMRTANMNMVRIWGGGQYEQESFYELCDQKGILIWHDLMFACSVYPATSEFIENVKAELDFQIPRLRYHASLALWCGDNEAIGATRWGNAGNPDARAARLVMYDRLNRELEKKVAEHDPDRTFWPSSPCGGAGNFADGWHNDSQGDMHYWEVWHGGKNLEAYYSVKPRFCSEFGYQSYPSLETVRKFCPPEHFNVFSPEMDHHQKCREGNTPIFAMLGKYFRMPDRFENFLYLSQVLQAVAIKTGVEFWRTLKPRCMGTLFWQLNDNWPVISWSSIEYGGKWKLLHYQARKFYAPVIVCAVRNECREVEVFVCNELVSEIHVEVAIRFFSFAGKLFEEFHFPLDVPAGHVEKVKTFPNDEPAHYDPRKRFMELELSGGASARNTFFLAPCKHCELEDPAITYETEAVPERDDLFLIKFSVVKPAFHVALDVEGIPGFFSDNDFTLLPQEQRIISFECREKTSPEQFSSALKITHLRASYA